MEPQTQKQPSCNETASYKESGGENIAKTRPRIISLIFKGIIWLVVRRVIWRLIMVHLPNIVEKIHHLYSYFLDLF